MSITFHLDIVSAEAEIFSGRAEMISVTGVEGELGILPGHTPLLTAIKPGEVRVKRQGGTKELYYVSGGMLEVQPTNVTILADTIQRAADLDEAEAIRTRERAEKVIAEHKDDIDYTRAQVALAQAAAQLRAIRRLREQSKK